MVERQVQAAQVGEAVQIRNGLDLPAVQINRHRAAQVFNLSHLPLRTKKWGK